MALPPLTPEQRAEASARAVANRRERAEIKARIKSGVLSIEEVIAAAAENEAIGKLRASDLLEALPGIGPIRALKVMDELGIARSRRVRGLGPNQVAALLERFG